MNALVLGVVLAAGSGLEASGAVTAGLDVSDGAPGATTTGLLHGRAELRRDFGRAWASARGSLLVTPGSLVAPITDLGSSVVGGYRAGEWVEAVSVEVSPFFVPTSRRASFDWRGNWLLDPVNPVAFSPTVAADLKTRLGTAWLAGTFKTEAGGGQPTLQPDVFLGVDVPLPASLRVELRAAWVRRGDNPFLPGPLALPRFALGGAGRVSWTWNEPVAPMLDFFTYGRDPTRFERFFERERRHAPRAAQLFLEGGVVSQQLASALVFAAPTVQHGGWADLQGRLRLDDVRLFATARVQSAAHVMLATGVPDDGRALVGETAPLLEVRLGVDGTPGRTGLTPGLLVSVTRPAFLLSDQGHFVLGSGKLAAGVAVASVVTPRASLRWDVASFAALVGELAVTLEPAAPRFAAHLAAQARF